MKMLLLVVKRTGHELFGGFSRMIRLQKNMLHLARLLTRLIILYGSSGLMYVRCTYIEK
jgi:hypothetical protein